MDLKLHIIVVTLFVFIGMGALLATGKIQLGDPPPAPEAIAPEKVYDEFIQIDSASWGMNCVSYANRYPQQEAEDEDDTPPLPLRRDNVLRALSSLCNGYATCNFTITSETLGKDPVPSCTKELRIEYRCNDMEKVRRESFFDNQEEVILDCRPPEESAAENPAAATPAEESTGE
jgi:hypothetical protein